jgi:hypothetical protein
VNTTDGIIPYQQCSEILTWAINCEWSNQQTMIVELIIGGLIGLGFGFYFYKREERKQIKREKYAKGRIISLLKNIQEVVNEIEHFVIARNNVINDLQFTLFSAMLTVFKAYNEHLDKFVNSVSEDIDLSLRDELLVIVNNNEAYYNLVIHTRQIQKPEKTKSPSFYNIQTLISAMIEKLKK